MDASLSPRRKKVFLSGADSEVEGNQRNQPDGIKMIHEQDALNSTEKAGSISPKVLKRQSVVQQMIESLYSDAFTG